MPTENNVRAPSATNPSRRRRAALPIAPTSHVIRKSPAGRWRAAVLIAVHVLIALHIAHWKMTGQTLSPLEPSEGMEFAKRGVVNAGLIFFALAIVSTALLGRWFCGWGCHLVALQDLSRWALEKVRVRPKPLRSSVLIVVPLAAFLYMFIAPAIAPLALKLVGRASETWTYHATELLVTDFWRTFPPWIPALATFVVCGGAIIYVLGAKGFCTYACPYGAAFSFADRYAPMRIRVTEDCTGNGHCTAVCTSNVRVHEEVREFGMVVDPGCMKCLDCVQVCPNDALFVGVGKPAAIAPRIAEPRHAPPKRGSSLVGWMLVVPFVYAAFLLFEGFDRPERFRFFDADFVYAGILTAISLAVLLVARGKSRRPREATMFEELLLGGTFLLAVFAFRGEFVPFLFAMGLAATTAFLLTQGVLLLLRRQLGVLGMRLKRDGRLLPLGRAYAAGCVALTAGVAWAATQRVGDVRLRWDTFDRVRSYEANFHAPDGMARLPADAAETYERAIRYDPRSPMYFQRLGVLHTLHGRHDAALATYTRGLVRFGDNPMLLHGAGMLDAVQGRIASAVQKWETAVAADPAYLPARASLADGYAELGAWSEAAACLTEVLRQSPGNVDAHVKLAVALTHLKRFDEARRSLAVALRALNNRDDLLEIAEWIEAQSRLSP